MLVTALWAAVVAITFLQVSIARGAVELKGVERSIQQTLAFQRAEGTMDAALRSFFTATNPSTWGTSAATPPDPTGCPAAPAFGPGTTSACFVSPDPIPVSGGTAKRITTEGYVPQSLNPAATRRVQVVAYALPVSPYSWPAFGALRVVVRSGTTLVDSYDSSSGSWAPNSPLDQRAPIRTDGISTAATTEAIQVAAGAEVHGSLTVGPGVPPSAAVFVATSGSPLPKVYGDGTDNANYTASTEAFSASSPVSPAAVPAPVAPSVSAVLPACANNAAAPKRYCVGPPTASCPDGSINNYSIVSTGNNCYLDLINDGTASLTAPFTSFSMGGGSQLRFSGNITLTTSSTSASAVSFGSNVVLRVDSGKSATFIANSNVTFGNGAHVNDDAGNRPNQFELKVAGSRTVELGGSTTFQGRIYAPQSTVNIGTGGGTTLFGSAIGNVVDLKSNGAIHYDRSLDPNNGISHSGILFWRDCVSASDCPL